MQEKQQPKQHPAVRDLLLAALEKPAAERAQFLDEACAGDASLRAEVESLAAALERRGEDFLATAPEAPPAAAGDVIGRYKLLQPIGEGGFGTVYMAEQQHPVRRRVALKVIKLGMDTKQVIARFEAERQALALMDHPNIAKVLDAGATDTGRPYFVMELVQGVPITQYCDEASLGTRQRLELFVQVCRAVQHAHQKGIIHRDIKPSNVLVTLHDGTPVPKVIDFGVAKATHGQRLTEKTLFTEFRQMVGTPEYMAPEQAGISGLDADTRSDVYGLGVLLYELLTGTTPFEPKELRSKAYDEIQRIIREVEPPAPSTRLSTLAPGTLGTVAARRGTDAAKLGRLMRGELDWIVMKCLEKERGRRYPSALTLAEDVERWLFYEPVGARPIGKVSRAARWCRRKPALAALAALVALTCTVGIAGITIQWLRAEKAWAAEAHQRKLAEDALTESEALNAFLVPVLRSSAHDVLLRTTKDLDEGMLRHRPKTEAAVRYTLGETYRLRGEWDLAEPQLYKAMQAQSGLFGPRHWKTANSRASLAAVLHAKGDYDGAERLYLEGDAIEATQFPRVGVSDYKLWAVQARKRTGQPVTPD